jgi:hypothetical protein
MAISKVLSKKIKSSTADGDFLTVGDVVTSQTYFHAFQSLTTPDQLADFADRDGSINLSVVIPRQSGIITDTSSELVGTGASYSPCELFSEGDNWVWQRAQINGTQGGNIQKGSQMLGYPNGDQNDSIIFDNDRKILLQGWKIVFKNLIDISGTSVDFNDPTTYAGIPVYLYYNASPPLVLTVTPPSSSGDIVRSVGFIWGAYSGNNDAILIFFDPDGFYAVV